MKPTNKPLRTGKIFLTRDTEFGHKEGTFCLTCGIMCGKKKCDNCNVLQKCKLCKIVCKINETNRIYFYVKDESHKEKSYECYQDVKTYCRTLNERGFCKECSIWEDLIKNRCFICQEPYINSYRYFKERGNCCVECNTTVNTRIKYSNKFGKLKNPVFNR